MEEVDLIRDFQIQKATDEEAEIVSKLINKFDELFFLQEVGNILVVANNKRKVKEDDLSSGKVNPITITKIPPKYENIIEQLTGKYYSFILEFIYDAFDQDSSEQRLDMNQFKALAYFELRKIRTNFKIGKLRKNDWIKIIHGLGKEFDRLGSTCQDILADNFTWDKCLTTYSSMLEEEND